ncbi:dnaJ homolog subfamily C member 8 [Microplitis demolitor]|uniref:dnaJ homolog subfamily C member 8 n=1 Tax=Microplitis demolitor TaxID=69319 RepID=UPI0004CD6B77|nr:dnaJ homolog subfamily C member 8 [Microplitis demolitor]
MAAQNSSLSNDFSEKKEDEFNDFYTEVKEIEKRDSVLTPKQQIDRLLRPGSSYFNLNPFEVLQIDPDTVIDEIKKKYRRMSILVHPDKNQDDADRAQQAFEIVNKAWKTLENEETRAKCMDVIEEAKARTDHMIAEKKKKLKREIKDNTSSVPMLEEESEKGYRHAVWVMTMKLFADMERRRRELATRDAEQRKRKREEELSAEAQAAIEKEWQKNFEESRQSRVDSWKAFQSKSGTTNQKKTKKLKSFKPPKTKAESR